MARSEIFIDVETGTLLDSFDSTLSAPNQSFTYGDAIDLQVTGVRKNQGVDSADVPWSVIDMTGKDFRVAIGTLDRLPFAGDFTVNASTSIDYNATEAEVDAALNADATITAEGGVTVSALAAGGWRVTFVTDGAKTALAGNENTLLPSSSIYLDLQRAGDTNVQEVWMMRIETNPSAYSQLTDAIPAPTVAIEQVRNGDSGNNISEVQAVTMTGTATGGTYALTLDGVATGEIAYNADSVAIEDAIALLPIVGGDTDLITISGDSQAFTVSFDSTLGDLSNLLVDDSNLVGLTGKAGNLNINTVEIIELLNGSQSQQAFFEVVLYDTDNSQGQTVSLSTVAVIQDIIPDSPPSVTPVVEYADKIHTHPISDVTNLQSELNTLSDDITTIENRDWVLVPNDSINGDDPPTSWQGGVLSIMQVTLNLSNYPKRKGNVYTDFRTNKYLRVFIDEDGRQHSQGSSDGLVWGDWYEIPIIGEVVDLTTAQTVAGDKTLSGQLELTGQLATTGDSAMNRDLGDARWLNKIAGDILAGTTYTVPNLAPTSTDSLVTFNNVSKVFYDDITATGAVTSTFEFIDITTGTAIVRTLPAAATVDGYRYKFLLTEGPNLASTDYCRVIPQSGELVRGVADAHRILSRQGDHVEYISRGGGWWIINDERVAVGGLSYANVSPVTIAITTTSTAYDTLFDTTDIYTAGKVEASLIQENSIIIPFVENDADVYQCTFDATFDMAKNNFLTVEFFVNGSIVGKGAAQEGNGGGDPANITLSQIIPILSLQEPAEIEVRLHSQSNESVDFFSANVVVQRITK